ncbi:HPP family protein [Bacterioplanes sanyensis]|uniref:HPP family protein n=1 Tax=Bacterioplanes sanyensis TaxID=1249553 RepID=A0A222FJM2_9GAMM|nr:HPP family protein [Bacterioplanes sanyensis]ASP39245.1 HPP family protein [Bacterioplanes sanyensis]
MSAFVWRRVWTRLSPPLSAGLGAGGCIAILALLSAQLDTLLLMAPFGATMVILYALPSSPLAQPRNIIGGHVLTTAIGLLLLWLCLHWGSAPDSAGWLGVAVGLGVAAMMALRCVHPPAGANPLLVLMLQPEPWFIVTPVLCGALLIVVLGMAYHRALGQTYPVVQR